MLDTVREIARVQNAVNAALTRNPSWYLGNYPYYRKCWQEAAEIVDHLGDNWWKRTPFDRAQVRMEIVDIFHFALSEAIMVAAQNSKNGDLDSAFERVAVMFGRGFDAAGAVTSVLDREVVDPTSGSRFIYVHEAVEPFIESCVAYARELVVDVSGPELVVRRAGLGAVEGLVLAFAELCARTGVSFAELAFWYGAKAALNRFRQTHGYREGTYVKIWNGREDNTYLADMESDLVGLDLDDVIESVTLRLGHIYRSVTSRVESYSDQEGTHYASVTDTQTSL